MKNAQPGQAPFTILVVEDDALQLKVLTDILKAKALKPIGCRTGKEALEACQQKDVHVAIIDLRLPDMNGLELLRRLKHQTPDMKVIIHTGYATLESAMEAVNREAFAYVLKLGHPEELLAHVHRAFHTYLAGYSEELEREVNKRSAELSAVNDALRQEIAVREHAEKEIKKQSRNLQQLSMQLINAQEAERRRISRELHDVMGQTLTAMSLNVAAIEKEFLPEESPIVRERLSETSVLIDQTLDQIRELSRTLRPSILDDLGLIPALKWYIKRYANRLNTEISFEVMQLEERLRPEIETALYRIVQEALTNIAKHAQANRVHISLERKQSIILASIEDNGRGFEVQDVSSFDADVSEYGIGLLGMQERVMQLNGEFTIQSSPGQGTTLCVEIPLRSTT